MAITEAPPYAPLNPMPPRPPRRARVTRAPLSPVRQTLGAASLTLALLMVWFLFYAFLLTPLQNHHDQGVLYSKLRQHLAEETAPIGGAISPGLPVALMDVPGAGIKREVVVEGTSSSNLTLGPGHRRDTPLPGQPGRAVVMGRAQLFGAPFSAIASLKPGALIKFTTGEGVSKYVVQDVRYSGDKGPPGIAPGGGALVLETAQSSGWRSGWAPSRTVFVDAALTTKPYGAAVASNQAARPVAVPKAEQAMQGDSGALYVLVLWLPLLLGAVMFAVWAYARWGRWQAWVTGVPLLLATLWGVSKVAVQLLPNLT